MVSFSVRADCLAIKLTINKPARYSSTDFSSKWCITKLLVPNIISKNQITKETLAPLSASERKNF